VWTATYVLAYLEAVASIDNVWIGFDKQAATSRNREKILRRIIITIGSPKQILKVDGNGANLVRLGGGKVSFWVRLQQVEPPIYAKRRRRDAGESANEIFTPVETIGDQRLIVNE
jgi:hypothetical protein